VVLERLKRLGIAESIPIEPEMAIGTNPTIAGPELHPLDFEWYFTKKTSEDLAEDLSKQAEEVLCLSAPTVAAAVSRLQRRVVLVDHNPMILHRVKGDMRFLQFIIADIANPLPLKDHFDAVFFDAPWYPEFVSLWLWRASQLVRAGGLIAFALFPPLLRSTAKTERDRILNQASQLGPIEVQEAALLYDTPLFEQEAMAQSGLVMTSGWRRADLAVLRVTNTPERSAATAITISQPEEIWDSFLIGTQVVKLRHNIGNKGDFILAPVEGCTDYVLPSVSRRDPRRKQIDLWTSRNRVARVGRRDMVSWILEDLTKNRDLESPQKHTALSSLNKDSQKQILGILRVMLLL
jgi:hypothetical protein